MSFFEVLNETNQFHNEKYISMKQRVFYENRLCKS